MVKGIENGSRDMAFSGQSLRRAVVEGVGGISDPCTAHKQVWQMLGK